MSALVRGGTTMWSRRIKCSSTWITSVALLLAAGAGLAAPYFGMPLVIIGIAGVLVAILVSIDRVIDIPTLCLMAFCALLPLTALKVTTGLNWADVFLFLCGPFAVLTALRRDTLTILQPYRPIILGGSAIVFGGLVGSFRSTDLSLSLQSNTKLALMSLVMPVVVGLLLDSIRKFQLLALSFLIATTISATLALMVAPDNPYMQRRSGLTHHPNTLGEMSVIGLAFSIALLLYGSRRQRIAALIVSAILTGGVMVSGSRGALLGVGVTLLVAAILSHRRWLIVAAMLLPMAVVLFSAVHDFGDSENALARLGQQISGNAASSAKGSDRGRISNAVDTLDRIEANPLTGSGFVDAQHAHTVPLQILMATGILGLAGFLFIFYHCGWKVFRFLIRSVPPGQPISWVLTGSLCSYIASFAMHLVSNPLWDRASWLLPVLVVGSRNLLFPLWSESNTDMYLAIVPSQCAHPLASSSQRTTRVEQ